MPPMPLKLSMFNTFRSRFMISVIAFVVSLSMFNFLFSYGLIVLIHLEDFFDDERSRCKIFVDTNETKTTREFLLKIRKVFNIKDQVNLFANHTDCLYYIPDSEDIRIFKSEDVIIVKKNKIDQMNDTEAFSSNEKLQMTFCNDLQNKNHDMNKITNSIKQKAKLNRKVIEKTTKETYLKNHENYEKDIVRKLDEFEMDPELENQMKDRNIFENESLVKKQYKPSYSFTTFDSKESVVASRKHSFTMRSVIEPVEISTKPKIIPTIKKDSNEFHQIEESNEMSESDISDSESCEKKKVKYLDNQDNSHTLNNVIKKRKRRKRRKKVSNNKLKQNLNVNYDSVNVTSSPMIFVSAAPKVHLRFDEEFKPCGTEENFLIGRELSDNEIKSENSKIDILSNIMVCEATEMQDVNSKVVLEKKLEGNVHNNDITVTQLPIDISSRNCIIENRSFGSKIFHDQLKADNARNNKSTIKEDEIRFKKSCSNTFPEHTQKTRMSVAMQKAMSAYFEDLTSMENDFTVIEKKSNRIIVNNNNEANNIKNTIINKSQESSNCEQNSNENTNGKSDILLSDIFLESEILKKPIINCLPNIEDIIAFKTIILGADYSPQISMFLVAEILNTNNEKNELEVLLKDGIDQLTSPKGKFSFEDNSGIEMDSTEKEVRVYHWEDLIEPRLLYCKY